MIMKTDILIRLLLTSIYFCQTSSFLLSLECFGHSCMGRHSLCEISYDKQFSGECHGSPHDMCRDKYNYTLHRGQKCRCDTNDCIQQVQKNSQSSHLNPTSTVVPGSFICGVHNCHQPHHCHLFKSNIGTIEARCILGNMQYEICRNRDSIFQGLGCYCNTQSCVDNALYVARTTTIAPTTTTSVSADPHLACVGLQCDQFKPICNLFENSSLISGRCVDQMVGSRCDVRQDITTNDGCSCKDTHCVINALLTYQQHYTDPTPSLELTAVTDFSKMNITQSPVTSTQFLSSTSSVEQATTQPQNAQQIEIESTTVQKTSAYISSTQKTTSTTTATTTTQTTSSAAISTTALPTTASTPTTTMTTMTTEITTIFVLTWTCLDQECPYPQYCILKLGSIGLHATCEDNKNGSRCDDHTYISKEGCWCDTPLCVARAALHCFGTNCPADQQCKVTKTMDGNYTGTCSPLGTQNSSLCDRKLQQSECNCWTQSCIDFFKTKTAPLPTTESTSTSATTESSTTANTTQSPTTVTTTATTTKPTSTLASTTLGSPRVCNTCGLQAIQIPCSTREINMDLPTTCPVGQDYCMTDIIQDASGNVEVYKRCVDLATCKREWISETADQDYCKQYGVITNPAAFSCHFCCVNDSCNSHMLPNSTTLYTKSNK